MQPVKIPNHVDMPHTLLFWSADELIPFAVLLGIGIFVGGLPICVLLGAALVYVFRRYRDSKPDGYMLYAIYWYTGLPIANGRSCINPFVRKVVP